MAFSFCPCFSNALASENKSSCSAISSGWLNCTHST